MSAAKRVLLTLVCVLVAILLLVCRSLLTAPPGYAMQTFRQSLSVAPVWLMFALPVWVLLIPFIIWLKDTEGWRGFVILVLGIGFGPLLMLVLALVQTPHRFNGIADGFAIGMAAGISILTSLLYFFLLRIATRRRRIHPTA